MVPKKIKQDNCLRLSQSQSTAPCPVIHLSIMHEVAHKCSASKLASAFSGGLQGGTINIFKLKFSDFTMTNDSNHWQIPNWVGKFIVVHWNELIFPTVEPLPLHWSSAAQSQSCCSRWSSHVCSRRRGRRRAPRHPPSRLSAETPACWSRAVVLLASGSTAARGSRASL